MFLWRYFHWFHRHSPLNKSNWKLNRTVWQLPLLATVSPTLNIMHYSSFGTTCTCILNLPKDEVSISVCTASNDKMIQNWKWRVRKWPRPNLLFRRVSAGTKEKPIRIAGTSAWMKTRHLPYSQSSPLHQAARFDAIIASSLRNYTSAWWKWRNLTICELGQWVYIHADTHSYRLQPTLCTAMT
jgi:hypothetical protein